MCIRDRGKVKRGNREIIVTSKTGEVKKYLVPLSKQILFFFNDTATTEIYTLSLHDALPISIRNSLVVVVSSLILL